MLLLTLQLTPAAPGLSDLPPSPSTAAPPRPFFQNPSPLVVNPAPAPSLPIGHHLSSLPLTMSLSQPGHPAHHPSSSSASSLHLPPPPLSAANLTLAQQQLQGIPGSGGVPMAPSISAISHFSNHSNALAGIASVGVGGSGQSVAGTPGVAPVSLPLSQSMAAGDIGPEPRLRQGPGSESQTTAGYGNPTGMTPEDWPALAELGLRLGPALRPLDMLAMDNTSVYDELERTIDGMKGWLECVEDGLEVLLRPGGGVGVEGEAMSGMGNGIGSDGMRVEMDGII